MLTVDKNKIKITRGDTMPLEVSIMQGTEPYEPQEGDSIRLAISKGYFGEKGYALILDKEVPLDTLAVTITAEETKALAYGTYNYDVQITYSDGTVDTFISSTLTVTGEVE